MTLPGILASGGLAPGAPTIGTATDGGNGTSVSVAFTAPTWTGKGTGTVTYTATSSPGGLTGTSTSSPITVSGLTTGTAYTFTVRATTSYGVSGPSSASSNSVTPVVPGAYDSIATATPSGTGTVTFSNIPQTFAHLELRMVARSTQATSGFSDIRMRLNGDSGNNYFYNTMTVSGNAVNSTNNYGDDNTLYLQCYGANSVIDTLFSSSVVNIMDYTNTNKRKILRYYYGGNNSQNDANNQLYLANAQYSSTSAITDLSFVLVSGNYVTGTSFALYGIRGS